LATAAAAVAAGLLAGKNRHYQRPTSRPTSRAATTELRAPAAAPHRQQVYNISSHQCEDRFHFGEQYKKVSSTPNFFMHAKEFSGR
jgi:hypothetical protein